MRGESLATKQAALVYVFMVTGGLLFFVLARPPAARAQLQVESVCMEDLYNRFGQGGGLTCTANDIQIASVSNVVIRDDGCTFPGDTVTFDATLEVLLTAKDRHDIGIYLAQDGGDALNGSCLITTLPFRPNNEACTGVGTPFPCCTGSGTGSCSFVDLDGTGDDLSGSLGACQGDTTLPCADDTDCNGHGPCVAVGPGTQDTCGDIVNSGDPRNPILHDIMGVTVICVDSNNDGKLDVSSGTSWRQPGANELCLSPLYAFPGGPSKCRSGKALAIPIAVPKTIEVCKDLVPTGDLGLFNLKIDGNIKAADATDGDCTGPVAVTSGTHSVGEGAGTDTTLTAYRTDISCEDRVGRCVLDSSIHCVIDVVCDLAHPGDTCDLTPSPVAGCTNCTSLFVTVDPLQASDIVCTITNTNLCESAVCDPPIDPECDLGQECNPATGLCENNFQPTSAVCADTDGNDCTTAGCNGAGSCDQNHILVPASTLCSDTDGNDCTVAGCDGSGACDQTHVLLPASTACADTDGNACTTAGCDGLGTCDQNHLAVTCPGSSGQCDAGEACDPADGICKPMPNAPASTPCSDTDGNPCTVAGCDGAGSCDQNHVLEPASTPCPDTDGNLCTTAGCDGAGTCDQGHVTTQCTGECLTGVCDPATGLCIPEAASTVCADGDGNACTTAGCDGAGSCDQNHILEPASTPCPDTDGNLCTTAGCDGAGLCNQAHVTTPCPQDECNTGVCNARTGLCVPEPSGTPCMDTDGNVCTIAGCNGVGICDQIHMFEANSVPCPDTDGNLCTTAGCDGFGTCDQGHVEKACLKDECNTGVCHPGTGLCAPEPNSTPCGDTDGTVCTAAGCEVEPGGEAGFCVQTHVLAPDSTPCEDTDGDLCTTAGCDGAGTCDQSHANVQTTCDPPELPCDLGQTCNPATGQCEDNFASSSTPCDDADGNECTTAGCDAFGICDQGHITNTDVCDDGLYCTVDDTCQGGECTGLARDCGDGNECTADVCDEVNDQCVNDPVTLNGSSCDDGLFCTNPDTCLDGVCGGPARDCDAEVGQCHTGVCDEANDVCDGSPVPNGTPCDDGDVCTADDVCTEGDCEGVREDPLCGLDHQKCYRVRPKGWRFHRRNVMLEDQFGAQEMEVVSPKRFCNPADKNGEGIIDPTAHLACYKIARLRGQPAFERRQVVVENQFGQSTLFIVRADSLCVPAEKDGVPSDLNIDHFKCYKARVAPKTPKFQHLDVSMSDQFEEGKVMTVIKPKLLCNPVDKNGEGIINPEGHLTCYRVKTAEGQPKFPGVTVEDIEDQFSNDDGSLGARQGDCRKSSVICVPSTKRLASPSGAFLEVTADLLD